MYSCLTIYSVASWVCWYLYVTPVLAFYVTKVKFIFITGQTLFPLSIVYSSMLYHLQCGFDQVYQADKM